MIRTANPILKDITNSCTLIIGGGVMGSSLAYHLSLLRNPQNQNNDNSNNPPEITIIERDFTYSSSSSTLSAGGIRQQFSRKENIQMSRYGVEFLRSARSRLGVDVSFDEHGYLFLACNGTQADKMRRACKLGRDEAGCRDVKLLNREELRKKFPWLNVEDVVLGSYGETGEGWFDPYSLLRGFKKKNVEMGVNYVHGEAISARRDPKTGTILSVDVKLNNTDEVIRHNAETVVNAAGPYASHIMDILSHDKKLEHPLPVKPRKRCIYFFHSKSQHAPHLAPLTVDPSCVYFRTEGPPGNAHYICGAPPPQHLEKDACVHTDSLSDTHHREIFEEIIWPALYHRVPNAFDELKVLSSWAGYYEYNTLDQNAILGYHPEIPNCFLMNGFSGHGLQHSPAAGRAAAEFLEFGEYRTLDLGCFGFERCVNHENLVFEEGIV